MKYSDADGRAEEALGEQVREHMNRWRPARIPTWESVRDARVAGAPFPGRLAWAGAVAAVLLLVAAVAAVAVGPALPALAPLQQLLRP